VNSYLKFISERGMPLDKFGIKGIALKKLDALQLIQKLEHTGTAILGGDVLKLVNDRIEHTYDSWHCDRLLNETDDEYAQRALAIASEYIRAYQEPNKNDIWYLVVISRAL